MTEKLKNRQAKRGVAACLAVKQDSYRLRAQKWDVCVDTANALVTLSPERATGWIQRSFALHELKRTKEAFDRLFPAAAAFSEYWLIPYNLACYCAQLGRLDESKVWFQKSMAIDSKAPAKAAIDDLNLKPIWDSMSGSLWKHSDSPKPD